MARRKPPSAAHALRRRGGFEKSAQRRDALAGDGRNRKTGAPASAVRPATRRLPRQSPLDRIASILVSATAPRVRPSSSRISRCSRVCGIAPSSAATTSSAKSMPVAPASMVWTSLSWPGTSTKPSTSPIERRVGVAELDGDAARLLLRQAIGIDAGERLAPAWSCRGRCGRRCRRSWQLQLPPAGRRSSLRRFASRQRRSRGSASSPMRPITGSGSARRAASSASRVLPGFFALGRQGQRCRRQALDRQRAAADLAAAWALLRPSPACRRRLARRAAGVRPAARSRRRARQQAQRRQALGSRSGSR